jgi:hypothetical protein
MKTLALAALLTGISLSPLAAGPISTYQWKNRILVLDFPASETRALAEFEKQIRQNSAGLKDRDLVLFHVGELGRRGKAYAETLDDEARPALRRQLGLGESSRTTAVILIGKDGGTKSVQRTKLSLVTFFTLIDAMPMRRDEMRRP